MLPSGRTKSGERLRQFCETYFQGRANAKVRQSHKQFESYFLTFADGARLELMHRPNVPPSKNDVDQQFTGYIHLSFSADRVKPLMR
jgi:lactoylglutathione lyase